MAEPVWMQTVKEIANYAIRSVEGVDEKSVDGFIKALLKAKRVFIYGAGRSGLAARAFAMRLVHLDLHTYVIGETITPATHKDDIFVCISGSGETSSVVDYTKSAKKTGAKIACITSYPQSTLARMADLVLLVKGKTKIDVIDKKKYEDRQVMGVHTSLTPMGTLFEDVVMIFFDGVIAEMMCQLDRSEDQMLMKHTCVE
ncbi:MAG: 6-phospho-3-hexuloisomerase [Candidatus Altiarchaeota archaeon]|nr:6-phospho-3-hexuloisomerase [Candidatus Altiarchaeota archaeon]